METLVIEDEQQHFHDINRHGLIWVLINELLHIIVFIYTLYGMIQFKVKFIHMLQLVRWISYLIIGHSWYLAIKFATIAAVLYLFNNELDNRNISLTDYNCSYSNHMKLFNQDKLSPSSSSSWQVDSNNSHHAELHNLTHQPTAGGFMSSLDLVSLYARFLDSFGGPFKLLGNRATLMYGFYAIAIHIMLAIFPIELMYHKIGFNYIRFVLSDTGCMSDLYTKRKRHLDRLTSWSRNQTTSQLTLGMKMTLNQRDLRSRYADDCNQLAVQMVVAQMAINQGNFLETSPAESDAQLTPTDVTTIGQSASSQTINKGDSSSSSSSNYQYYYNGSQSHQTLAILPARTRSHQNPTASARGHQQTRPAQLIIAERKLSGHTKPLRPRLAINHHDVPSYEVKVANKNLDKFKPFVRSEIWFKFSMIIYPWFIFYYFSLLITLIASISIFFESTLADINEHCKREVDPQIDLFSNWSLLDKLLYMENQYTVFALSCASSFYCSYYFGTILELIVWKAEIAQQLDLCKIIIQLNDESLERHLADNDSLYRSFEMEPENVRLSRIVEKCHNDFGGLRCILTHLKQLLSSKQSQHFRTLELIAIRLLSKKQTLLRATYINMSLFMDELTETKFMTQTILRRTTQIAFGFAIMASITRSQFKANYWHLTFLLATSLAILNLYLVCAATINCSVNKLLVQVHSLISASLKTSTGVDADLFEFWVRHILSFGEDRDVMSYKIYGYKITWSTILNFDSAVCTAYFCTIY